MAKKIYINPGHSNSDPGAVGYETERKLNVKVSDFMSEYLLTNYECETRVYSNDSLAAVCNDANKWGANLFVSNHFNAGGGDGYEALVYNQKRVELGKIFAKHVNAAGQNLRLYGAAPGVKIRSDLYVLGYTSMPAILNESAFVDNKKDIQDWNDDAELKKLGIAYAEAAAEFLGLTKKVVEAPKVEKPKVETPKVETPKVETPKVETPKKSIETIAREVLAGKWGNGSARKQALTKAGYDYDAVQKKVNDLL